MPADRRQQLLGRVAQAKAEIRDLKKATPHIFPQWQDLRNAEDEFERAKQNLERARAAWANLGKDQQ